MITYIYSVCSQLILAILPASRPKMTNTKHNKIAFYIKNTSVSDNERLKNVILISFYRNSRQMLYIIPHAGHRAKIFGYFDSMPHLLRVIFRRYVFHVLRKTCSESHGMSWASLRVYVVSDLPFEGFWTGCLK